MTANPFHRTLWQNWWRNSSTQSPLPITALDDHWPSSRILWQNGQKTALLQSPCPPYSLRRLPTPCSALWGKLGPPYCCSCSLSLEGLGKTPSKTCDEIKYLSGSIFCITVGPDRPGIWGISIWWLQYLMGLVPNGFCINPRQYWQKRLEFAVWISEANIQPSYCQNRATLLHLKSYLSFSLKLRDYNWLGV